MDIKEYEKLSARTFTSVHEIDEDTIAELHCIIGIETEAGELLDAYKKSIFYKRKLDDVNVAEEIGDLMWYISNLCRLKNLDLHKIMQNNINKLKIRYPEKFDEEKAINRDLNAERNELEK